MPQPSQSPQSPQWIVVRYSAETTPYTYGGAGAQRATRLFVEVMETLGHWEAFPEAERLAYGERVLRRAATQRAAHLTGVVTYAVVALAELLNPDDQTLKDTDEW